MNAVKQTAFLRALLFSYCFDNPNEDDCAKKRYEKTGDIKACDVASAKKAHDPTAENCTNDTNDYVEKDALLAISFHN